MYIIHKLIEKINIKTNSLAKREFIELTHTDIMSKQLMMNERPADNGPTSYGGGVGGGDGGDWPKASIGNYKGVMLCNRPNEVGGPRKADRTGPNVPFNSRVYPEEPIGWNPTKKLVPRDGKKKKKIDPNNALLKHKRFLKGLED